MRTKSIFGVKSITNLIYGLLMIAPFVAILSRVIYVQANPNAKDSYSDNYVSTIQQVNNNQSFVIGNDYIVKYGETPQTTSYGGWFTYNTISIDWTDYGFQNHTYNQFRLFNNSIVQLKDTDNNQYQQTNVWGRTLTEFTFNLKSFVNDTSALYGNALFYQVIYQTNKLDNAFEYSLSSFTQDNDIGVINFFGWFEGMFLNQSNAHNMVYLNFANWYMNYALLVSSSYLLFLALIWFVNYIRRILDKSMNHDFGGF